MEKNAATDPKNYGASSKSFVTNAIESKERIASDGLKKNSANTPFEERKDGKSPPKFATATKTAAKSSHQSKYQIQPQSQTTQQPKANCFLTTFIDGILCLPSLYPPPTNHDLQLQMTPLTNSTPSTESTSPNAATISPILRRTTRAPSPSSGARSHREKSEPSSVHLAIIKQWVLIGCTFVFSNKASKPAPQHSQFYSTHISVVATSRPSSKPDGLSRFANPANPKTKSAVTAPFRLPATSPKSWKNLWPSASFSI